MTALALTHSDLFSVITTADRRGSCAVVKALFNLPRFGDTHIDYAADTSAQRNIWAAKLDEAVLHAERPVLLVATGASCFATAWWARLSPAGYVSRVAGALLFDPGSHGKDRDVAEKFASPRIALPFPSAIVDRSAKRNQIDAIAEGWGSGFLDATAERPGLIGGGSAWQHAHALIHRATALVVERRMRVADALGLED